MRDGVQYLMKVLYVTLGNKRYLHDIEKMFEDKLKDITPQEQESLLYLARDISEVGNDRDNAEQRSKRFY